MNDRLNIALDKDLKNKASKLYNDMGMNLSTAIKVFLRQSLVDNGLPFRPYLKNKHNQN